MSLRASIRYVLAATAFAIALPGCTQSFSPWGQDATLVLAWSVGGVPADAASCEAAGADRVRMSINREPVDWFDERLEWSCASGATRLDEMLRTGFFYLRWDILDADRQVVASTEWRAVELATGTTTIDDIAF